MVERAESSWRDEAVGVERLGVVPLIDCAKIVTVGWVLASALVFSRRCFGDDLAT